jgi:phosphoglycolate phosphatase
VNLALADHGLEPEPVEHLVSWIGPPLHDSFAHLIAERGVDTTSADLVEAYRRHYETICLDTPLYPDAADVVRSLAERHTLAVATSKPARYALRILEARDLADVFAEVVGPPPVASNNESKTETLGRALEALAVPRRDAGAPVAAMIGDRRHDIEAARAHDLLAVGARWGFGTDDELRRAGAHHLVSAISELGALLER